MPLVQSGISLVVSSAVTSLLGFAFWLIAANRYSAAEVGVSAAAIATMLVLADFAHMGLRTGLVRFLPIAGAGAKRLIVNCYGLSMGIGAAAALLFVAGLDLWSPELLGLQDSAWSVALFVLATAFWVVFLLEDSVLLGLRLTPWVPVENGLFGVAKIVLLLPLVSVGWELSVFLAWALPVFVIVVGVNGLVVRALNRRAAGVSELTAPTNGGRRAPSELPMSEVLSYSLADWAASAARSGVIGILPLVVLAVVGPEGSAYYLVAWTITYSIYVLSANIGDALLAEVSYDDGNVDRHTLHGGLLSMAISVPIVLVAIVVAPWVLRAFGPEYAEESTGVLRLLLVGAIPNVVTRTFVGRLRAEGRMRAVIAYEVVLSLTVLLLGWVLLAGIGIAGLGLAWLLTLSAAAGYVVVIETLWWWAPRLGPRSVRWLAVVVRSARKLGRLRLSPGLRRDVRRALAEIYTSKPRWRRLGLSADSQTLSVAGHEGRPPLRVELARSSWGAELLVKRLQAISSLGKLVDLSSFRALVPYPIEHHVEPGNEYLVESAISGRTGVEMAGRLPVAQLVGAVVGAVSQLQRATAGEVTFDERSLDHWVSEPLQQLSSAARMTPVEVESVGTLLREGLRDRSVASARLHGNLTLDVALFDPYGRLTGLLDWEWSEIGPSFVDWGSLALSAMAVESRTDIGHAVSDALADPARFADHPALSPWPGPGVDARVVVLASWLHLLTPAVRAAATTPAGRFWMARNVQPVLARLPRLVTASA